ncbi:MAG: DUF2007 domain-containing protein [Deltaproteobacteria bacterium]|nr:DUF2007 domain-containing protein [Deltaproteobacteria bacterium]
MSKGILITVARPSDPAEQMLAEALLEGADIAFFSKNSQVQNLFGAGQIGGFNLATGGVQIQVSREDENRALELLDQRLGEELPDDPSTNLGAGEGRAWDGENEKVEAVSFEAVPLEEEALESLHSPELDRYAKFSKYSVGWAVMSLFGSILSLGGLTAALAIFFGFKALSVQKELPKGMVSITKPIFGIVVGLFFLLLWLWIYREIGLRR